MADALNRRVQGTRPDGQIGICEIDISKKKHYAIIPGLDEYQRGGDELIRQIDDKKLHIDQFVFNWMKSNLNIAINNLLSSI